MLKLIFLSLFSLALCQPPQIQTEFEINISSSVEISCPFYDFCEYSQETGNLFWGISSDECDPQNPGSGIKITPEIPGTAQINQPYVVAILKSRNTVIQGDPGAPNQILITFAITVEGIQIPFEVIMEIDETDNSEPCDYPSDIPCADRHIYTLPQGGETFVINNINYRIAFPPEPNNSEFIVIIQEDCNPELFAGPPIEFPLVISCDNCCPVYIWCEPTARMYLPWLIRVQTNNLEENPIFGNIVLRSSQFPDFERIIFTNVEANKNITELQWKPHKMLPGNYTVFFENSNENSCSSDNMVLRVR